MLIGRAAPRPGQLGARQVISPTEPRKPAVGVPTATLSLLLKHIVGCSTLSSCLPGNAAAAYQRARLSPAPWSGSSTKLAQPVKAPYNCTGRENWGGSSKRERAFARKGADCALRPREHICTVGRSFFRLLRKDRSAYSARPEGNKGQKEANAYQITHIISDLRGGFNSSDPLQARPNLCVSRGLLARSNNFCDPGNA